MSLLLPYIGVTDCSRAESLLENYSNNIVGTFWVMNGYGFDKPDTPDWWINIVLEDNQAQAILDAYERDYFFGEHDNPLYLGFCIIVTTDENNPANFSYVIQHLRMVGFEGVRLLRILAKKNISAHTEVTPPISFLNERYCNNEGSVPESMKDMSSWSVQLWEDYCSYLLAVHGQEMTSIYWSKKQ